jgi:hypothetical protein
MNRRNFGGTSGVIVDVCAQDGVWFDTLELPRVLAFTEAGGLELARQRQRAERDRSRPRGPSVAPEATFSARSNVDLEVDDLLEIVGRAIELVTRRFGK